MCDVIFITPNISDSIRHESMGTLLLATILKENGISAKVWNLSKFGDINDFESYINNAVKIIGEAHPKVVSFYTRCDFYHVDLRLAEAIKSNFKDIYVVFGGPQADITAVDTISEAPYVDFICCGEGEKTIYPFFASLIKNKPDTTVDGLVWRDGEEVIKNPRPVMLDELDSLPFIDYSLAECGDMRVDKLFPIEVGRGCPFGCVFCSTKSFWGRKYRLKSSQRIFEEIKQINKTLGVTRFNFLHDMFTFNRKNIIEICGLIKTLDFPMKWACSARLDCLDPELVDIMKDAGLIHVYFGIETGSPRMQKLINKRLKLENAAELLEYINSKGIVMTTSFIYGFPDEGEEDISMTMSFIAKLLNMENVKIQTHLCAFLPETDLTKAYKDKLTPTEQFSDIIGDYAVIECMDLIKSHPKLFDQMYEYKTELRKKLEYFEVFFKVYKLMITVYNYLHEKYGENGMFSMYEDFVKANNDALSKIGDISEGQIVKEIINDDKFAKSFNNDENFDIISDFYRLNAMASSKTMTMETICFDIKCVDKYKSLAEYPKGKFTVICNNGKFATLTNK